jgi:lipoprotein-releasing system permease protein
MHLLACLALFVVAACNSKQPAREQQTAAPTTPAVDDPWNVPAGSARADIGSAGDPTWAHDPPEVLRAKINGVNAHVVVLKSTANFPEYRDALGVVEKMPGVVAAEPFIFAELDIEKAGRPPQRLSLKAVDPARAARVLTVGRHMKTGTLDSLAKSEPPSIILGDALARVLDVAVGDDVTVKRPKDAVGPLLAAAKPTVFRVTGTFHMEFDVYDEQLGLASLSAVQAMLGRGDQVMGIEMTVEDLVQADEIAKAIEHVLGGPPYRAMDWYELNKNLFTAVGHPRP